MRSKLDQLRAMTRAPCHVNKLQHPDQKAGTEIEYAVETAVRLGGRADAEGGRSFGRFDQRATSKQGEEVMVSSLLWRW